MDFQHDRIHNGWILAGFLSALAFRIYEWGWYGVCGALIPTALPFILLYPIYKIGALGAGDIKLLMTVGSFLNAESTLRVILYSFIIAAVFSLIKMISESNFKERMRYLFSYLLETLTTGEWKPYGEFFGRDIRTYKSNKIHFALPVCIGAMFTLGGLI